MSHVLPTVKLATKFRLSFNTSSAGYLFQHWKTFRESVQCDVVACVLLISFTVSVYCASCT